MGQKHSYNSYLARGVLHLIFIIIIIIIALQHSEDLYRVDEEQKLVNENES